jgi:hypothetical protein
VAKIKMKKKKRKPPGWWGDLKNQKAFLDSLLKKYKIKPEEITQALINAKDGRENNKCSKSLDI